MMGLLAYLLPILLVVQYSSCFSCTSQKVSIVVDFVKTAVTKSVDVNTTDFPWHVAILKKEKEDISFVCSGTLIERQLVVTAASCVVDLPLSVIKVGMGLSLIHNPLQIKENMNLKLENVSAKYYPFHTEGYGKESHLAMLKLQNNSQIKTPQLSTLLPTDRLSKHCFSLGWGAKISEPKFKNFCPKMNMNSALSILYPQPNQNKAFLGSFFKFCSSLSLGNIFKNNLFDYFFSGKSEAYDEQTCVVNEFSHLKLAKVSSKAKFHYKYLCAEDSLLCISGWNSTDLANKVDIGSPIFCKIKKPSMKHRSSKQYSTENQFGLAGIITNKEVERIPLLKYNSTLSVVRANNITHYAHFIFAVLKHNF